MYSQKLTKEQEYMLVYETLLDNALQVAEGDESLAEYAEAIMDELFEFQENFPEIVAEYNMQLINSIEED